MLYHVPGLTLVETRPTVKREFMDAKTRVLALRVPIICMSMLVLKGNLGLEMKLAKLVWQSQSSCCVSSCPAQWLNLACACSNKLKSKTILQSLH